MLYLLVAQIVAIYVWYTASDTGKTELARGVQPRWLLLAEVGFCGLIWPITIPVIVSDNQRMSGERECRRNGK
jgi:hypothetical protein